MNILHLSHIDDHSNDNPYAKLEELARSRKQKLTDRTGKPIIQYLKKREEQAMIEQ